MEVTPVSNGMADVAATQAQKPAATSAQLANEETFLKLLVAQMKNQDPMKPQDGTEFLGQLAQFSQLEQLIAIRQQLSTLATADPQTTTPQTSGGGASNNRAAGAQ